MRNATYFVQGCPTCGRRLQIRVEYLGKRLACDHCHGRFVAADPANIRVDAGQPTNELLQRADDLLRSLDEQSVARRNPTG